MIENILNDIDIEENLIKEYQDKNKSQNKSMFPAYGEAIEKMKRLGIKNINVGEGNTLIGERDNIIFRVKVWESNDYFNGESRNRFTIRIFEFEYNKKTYPCELNLHANVKGDIQTIINNKENLDEFISLSCKKGKYLLEIILESLKDEKIYKNTMRLGYKDVYGSLEVKEFLYISFVEGAEKLHITNRSNYLSITHHIYDFENLSVEEMKIKWNEMLKIFKIAKSGNHGYLHNGKIIRSCDIYSIFNKFKNWLKEEQYSLYSNKSWYFSNGMKSPEMSTYLQKGISFRFEKMEYIINKTHCFKITMELSEGSNILDIFIDYNSTHSKKEYKISNNFFESLEELLILFKKLAEKFNYCDFPNEMLTNEIEKLKS